MLPSFFPLSGWRGPSWGQPWVDLGVSEHPAVLQLPLPCAADGALSPGVLLTLSTVEHPTHARSRLPVEVFLPRWSRHHPRELGQQKLFTSGGNQPLSWMRTRLVCL